MLVHNNGFLPVAAETGVFATFYSCDKTTRKLAEEGVDLGLSFQRVRVHDGRVKAWGQEQEADGPDLNCKQEKEQTGNGRLLQLSKSTSRDTVPPIRLCLLSLPK